MRIAFLCRLRLKPTSNKKSGKSLKTIAQYQRTLNAFPEVNSPKVRYLDEITEIAPERKQISSQDIAGAEIRDPTFISMPQTHSMMN